MTYRPTIRDYQEAVAHAFDIKPSEFVGPSRARRYAVPRQVLCGLLREMAKISYPRIGDAIERDHTTVMSSVRRFQQHKADPIYAEKIKAAREALQGGLFRSVRGKA